MIHRVAVGLFFLFLGWQVSAQSPFLLADNSSDYRQLYLDGKYELLLDACRTRHLSLTNANASEQELRQSTRDLLYAYFSVEKWDLGYLLSQDLIRKTDPRSEEYAVLSIIMGSVLNELGKPEEALPWFQEAYDLNRNASQLLDSRFFILTRYADFLRQTGEYTAAGRIYNQLIYGKLDDNSTHWKVAYLSGLIHLSMEMGLANNANLWFTELDDILQEQRSTSVASQLILAEYFLYIGKADQAASILDQIKTDDFQNDYWQSQKLIGKRLESWLDRLQGNRPNMEILAEGINPYLAITYYIESGRSLHLAGAFEDSKKQYHRALRLIRLSYNPEHPLYQKVVELLGITEWAEGHLGNAANHLNRAAELKLVQYIKYFAFLSDEEKQAYYFANNQFEDIYGSFIIANTKHQSDMARRLFDHLLVFKGLLFNTTLSMRHLIFENVALRAPFDKYLAIQSQLQVIKEVSQHNHSLSLPSYDSLLRISEELERELSLNTFVKNTDRITESMTRTWNDVRAKLEPDQALIEVMRFDQYDPVTLKTLQDQGHFLFLFLSRFSRHPSLFSLTATSIERQSKAYRNAINYRIKDLDSYAKVWQPVADRFHLDDFTTLFLVPDGMYNLINPSSLYDPSTNQYLLNKWDFEILGNASDLLSKPVRNNSFNRRALLLGNPDYSYFESGSNLYEASSQPIAPLPATREEVVTISSTLDETNTTTRMLIGQDANEPTLKSNTSDWASPTILHLATHGFTEGFGSKPSDDPLEQSGLLLTGADFSTNPALTNLQAQSIQQGKLIDNGVLYAREAMNLHLMTTDLVALSACESGIGKIVSSEGVYGLHRAFQTAGASSVLMTLWKVDDQATRDFMISFYQKWMESGDKKVAFRHAQQQGLEKYHDPYFWGAFMLIGK